VALPLAGVLTAPALAGLALSDLRPAKITGVMAVVWALAWFWMAYQYGATNALNRTGGFVGLMGFASLPFVLGWLLGRAAWRRRSDSAETA
jgi:hypothetical protein